MFLLKFVFLPAQHALLEQALVDGREVEAAGEDFHELLAVVRDAAAGTAEREAGTDEHRKAELTGKVETVAQIVNQRRL